MQVKIYPDPAALAHAAAREAASAIRSAIEARGIARVVAASAASQLEFLAALVCCSDIDWQRTEVFQLDEYLGLLKTHPASFTRFLQENLIGKTGIPTHHALDGDGDEASLIRDASCAIVASPVDVAFVGIGENGHLAFNDPPADFETEEPYITVKLDESCRRQQVGEGWFRTLAEVPDRAISMSVRQILKARQILAIVPDLRKARAVQACLEGEIGPTRPGSALRTHANATIFLDRQSASMLAGRHGELS